jgi:hypothetical protein
VNGLRRPVLSDPGVQPAKMCLGTARVDPHGLVAIRNGSVELALSAVGQPAVSPPTCRTGAG